MEIKVNNKEKSYIFKPRTKFLEISQNIENIISRVKFNVPLARHKGIIAENIDMPIQIVKAKIISDILEEINREESRFKVSEILVSDEFLKNGKLVVSIKGDIDE